MSWEIQHIFDKYINQSKICNFTNFIHKISQIHIHEIFWEILIMTMRWKRKKVVVMELGLFLFKIDKIYNDTDWKEWFEQMKNNLIY